VATSPLQPVGFFRITLPARDWTWSGGLLDILGVDESDPPTQDLWLERQHPDDRPAVQELVDEVLATGEPTAVWHRVVRRDRTVRRVLTAASGVRGADGTLEAVTGQVVDVTEPVRLTTSHDVDEALQRLSETRPAIDQAKGALMFAYNIDEETAFALMREYSQHVNRKVRDLAADLVESLSRPGGWSAGTRNLLDRLMRELGVAAAGENPGA
jgi:PAS domain S-box-containing protein